MHKIRSMSKALTPILVIATASGAIFSIMQWNARAAAESSLAELNQRLAKLEKSALDAQDAAKTAKEEASIQKENAERLTKERDEARSQPLTAEAAKPASEAKPQFDLRNMIGNIAKGMDDPEQRKAMKSMTERMVSGAYEKLFKDLGLSEADSKLVSELLGERNFVAMDRGRKLLTGKTDEASIAEIRKEIAATKTDYDAKVKAVIGEDKFRELGNYERTVTDRRAVDGFAREFDKKGQPLDDTQKEKLTTIMVEERLKTQSGANEIPDLGGGPGMDVLLSNDEMKARQLEEDAYQQRVAARVSQAGLSPDQVTTFQESQKRQNERKTWGRMMTRAFLMPK